MKILNILLKWLSIILNYGYINLSSTRENSTFIK